MNWKVLEIKRNRPVVIGSSKATNETSTKYSIVTRTFKALDKIQLFAEIIYKRSPLETFFLYLRLDRAKMLYKS